MNIRVCKYININIKNNGFDVKFKETYYANLKFK